MIFKTRRGSGTILVVIFLIIFLMVSAGGIFYYVSNKKTTTQDNVPPIIKQMIKLNEDIKKSTIDIYNASGKLDSISMVQSRITDIKSTIELISELRQLVKDNQKVIDRLLVFTQDHEEFFNRKNLAWVFAIKEFYNDHNVIQHHKSRVNYLASFETLLTYTHTNFKDIMENKSQKHMKNYDAYYMRYRVAADSHNRFNKKRIGFQTVFVEKY
ncbi:MAG: hypothetical protein KAJ25_09670, partial [Desulfobacula sp.]|nr:hypothetical protein [Desulfobacula sp.]